MRVIIDGTGLTAVSAEGEYAIVSASDASFPAARDYVVGGGRDYAELCAVISVKREEASDLSDEAAEAFGDSGKSVKDEMVRAAVADLSGGYTGSALKSFTARLKKNPSKESRASLLDWLKAEQFTLTNDGFIVGYKGVTGDGMSLHHGREDVSVKLHGKPAKTHRGKIPYPARARVRMDRSLVNADTTNGCSTGLHVGTLSFAQGFGNKVCMVLVDPADVVSVPKNEVHKMRVCGLDVVGDLIGKAPTAAVIPNPMTHPLAGISSAKPAKLASKSASKSSAKAAPKATAASPTPLVSQVAQAALVKIAAKPLKKRDLFKLFSKNRRAVLDEALDELFRSNQARITSEGFFAAV